MNCLNCSYHKIIPDPDPTDWFCVDDIAVVCTNMPNDKMDKNSKWASDRSEYKHITCSCRPYNVEKESDIPPWCPLRKGEE